MGTFQGHLLPGSLFIIFGIWWTSQIVCRLVICNNHRRSFYSSVTYQCTMHRRCASWPLEAALKISVTSLGIAAEVFASTNYGHGSGIIFIGDLQHVTMYAFFFMSGMIDILHFYHKILQGLDFLALALAFVAEAMLFSWHLHGRDPLDILVHTLLVYVIAASAVTTLLELRWHHSVFIALTRAYLVFLQGTWFLHTGFILYNPIPGHKPWDRQSDDSQLQIVMVFTWHFLGVFLAMGTVAYLSKCLLHKCDFTRATGEPMYEMVSSQDNIGDVSDVATSRCDLTTLGESHDIIGETQMTVEIQNK